MSSSASTSRASVHPSEDPLFARLDQVPSPPVIPITSSTTPPTNNKKTPVQKVSSTIVIPITPQINDTNSNSPPPLPPPLERSCSGSSQIEKEEVVWSMIKQDTFREQKLQQIVEQK